MGKYRSRSGCLTCRARRVKCDETRPVCNACSKKNRPCQWEAPHTIFRDYQPDASSSKSPAGGDVDGDDFEDNLMDVDGADESEAGPSSGTSPLRKTYTNDRISKVSSAINVSPTAPISPGSPFFDPLSRSSGGSTPGSLLGSIIPEKVLKLSKSPRKTVIPLTHREAVLVHHYTEQLGRWLDCTDATRQFTLGVPQKVKKCPVLCHAVLSFAARHGRDDVTADFAYQRCIALLIERLKEETASHDETLLCAIVILRFYEQLNVPSTTGSDKQQHLAGLAAIIRTSQGYHFVDPSAPTLREAAFWVYVRQCLYIATIERQPPDIDFSLQLHPMPSSMQDSHPLAKLRLETAWANQMTWHAACVVNFCFSETDANSESSHKTWQWQELWNLVQTWMKTRPSGFDPLYEEQSGKQPTFPNIIFAADWHAVSFVFYHLACILLLKFRPGLNSAARAAERSLDSDGQIVTHARAICGASKSSLETIPLSIIVCHTIFIWGPLISHPSEQTELIQLLSDFEKSHLWPTTWIINHLTKDWASDHRT